MSVQTITYTENNGVALLTSHAPNGTRAFALFPAVWLPLVQEYRWTHKGKNGFVALDAPNTTLAGILATAYGYKNGAWVRVEPNENYYASNYRARGVSSTLLCAGRARSLDKSQYRAMYERTKWRSKLACETLPVQLLRRGKVQGTLNVRVNTYLRHYIPKYVVLHREGTCARLDTIDGVSVRQCVLAAAMGYASYRDLPSMYSFDLVRSDPLDFRVNPDDNTFIATTRSTLRKHVVDDGVVFEVTERADRAKYSAWCDSTALFRVPCDTTRYYDRAFYIKVDANVADHIDDLTLNTVNGAQEVMVSDDIVPGVRPLKYLVADIAGIRYRNVYIAPVPLGRLKKALANMGDPKMRRIVAKMENRTGEDGSAYTKPVYVRKAKVSFNKECFDTTIYGGVGVYCLDCRASALYVPIYKSEKQNERSGTNTTRDMAQE